MSQYRIKTGKLGQKLTNAYQHTEQKFTEKFLQKDENSPSGYTLKTGKIGETVTQTYQKIENGVVGSYQKIENGVVGSYKKIENAFVDAFLVKEEDDEPANTPR